MTESFRPPHREERLTLALNSDLLERAREKAGSGTTLRAIMRAFLELWSSGAYPDLPEEAVQAQMRRAQKIPRKKKKKR